jgi:uridine kinase
MSLASFYNGLARMIASVRTDHPVRVAVDGIDAAGKTTLANALVSPLSQLGSEVIRASIDGFHRPKRLRYMRGKDSPVGYYYDSFDYEAVILYLLKPLGPDGDRLYRISIFDHTTDTTLTSDTRTASENDILVFDGVFLLRPELNPFWDFRIFVNVSIEAAIERAVKRDGLWMGGENEARRLYETRYFPGQRIYMEECDPTSLADVVVGNDDPMAPTLLLRKNHI